MGLVHWYQSIFRKVTYISVITRTHSDFKLGWLNVVKIFVGAAYLHILISISSTSIVNDFSWICPWKARVGSNGTVEVDKFTSKTQGSACASRFFHYSRYSSLKRSVRNILWNIINPHTYGVGARWIIGRTLLNLEWLRWRLLAKSYTVYRYLTHHLKLFHWIEIATVVSYRLDRKLWKINGNHRRINKIAGILNTCGMS